jgi:hypothetical protein
VQNWYRLEHVFFSCYRYTNIDRIRDFLVLPVPQYLSESRKYLFIFSYYFFIPFLCGHLKGERVSKIKLSNKFRNLYLITSNGYVATPYSWLWYTSICLTAGGPDPFPIQNLFFIFYFGYSCFKQVSGSQ